MAPTIPLDIIECIVEELSTDLPTLQALALVCYDYLLLAQKHLFRHVNLESSGNIQKRHLRLHDALSHHFHLGAYVKTLAIWLPDYEGHVSYATRSRHLPDTLIRLTQLRALHIVYLPHLDDSWSSLNKSLLHLFSLPSLQYLTIESIWGFPIYFLGYCHFIQHLHFQHTSFAASHIQLNQQPCTSKTRLKSLAFQFCHSQTLRRLIEFGNSPNSTFNMECLDSFTINPWTEHSSALAIEILDSCRGSLRELTWALGTPESSDNLRVNDFPSLERLTLVANLDGHDGPFRNLIHLLDSVIPRSSLPLDVHIQLVVPSLPSTDHILMYQWDSLDITFSALGKRRAVRRLSLEFSCPCISTYGFHEANVDLEGNEELNQKFNMALRGGCLSRVFVTHKRVATCDKICCTRQNIN